MHPQIYVGVGYPPELKNFSGPLCDDPLCFRNRPHFPREWGCRWSERAILNPNQTVTWFTDMDGGKLPRPITKAHRNASDYSYPPPAEPRN